MTLSLSLCCHFVVVVRHWLSGLVRLRSRQLVLNAGSDSRCLSGLGPDSWFCLNALLTLRICHQLSTDPLAWPEANCVHVSEERLRGWQNRSEDYPVKQNLNLVCKGRLQYADTFMYSRVIIKWLDIIYNLNVSFDTTWICLDQCVLDTNNLHSEICICKWFHWWSNNVLWLWPRFS